MKDPVFHPVAGVPDRQHLIDEAVDRDDVERGPRVAGDGDGLAVGLEERLEDLQLP
jgi:hypothetical protein